ncbi:MAG: DnaJ C-terminal domain-containing protein [Acidiferrobacterales bacterium]
MKFKDYYKIMGLSRDASADEIKRAYRKLARKYHPDVSKEPQAEERFKELGEAYEVLRDAQKRASYDHLGSAWQPGQEFTPPPDWQPSGFEFHPDPRGGAGNHHFSDFFESLFGHAFHAGSGTQGAGPRMRGQDQHSKITISLEDAYHGAARIIQLGVPERDAGGNRVMRNHTLQVQIPPGVVQGQQIRLAGQGLAGAGSAPRGDLYLEVELQVHPYFEPEGQDIYLKLPLTPWEAALGAQLTVPTLGGKVDVKIPAGSQSGQKLRLKGRGLGSKSRGDQYVVLQIVTPPAATPAAREIYKQMSRELPFNPRSHMGV